MLRITGGRWKGHALKVPAEQKTRPTLSKLRQAIFNSLQGWVENAKVLDLFAGSGALGFEALSRGASEVIFVESAPRAAALIRENSRHLLAAGQCNVITGEIQKHWTQVIKHGPFDLIFADPPYHKGLEKYLLENAPWDKILVSGGFFVLEHAEKEGVLPSQALPLVKIREKTYGDTRLTSYRHGGV